MLLDAEAVAHAASREGPVTDLHIATASEKVHRVTAASQRTLRIATLASLRVLHAAAVSQKS